MKRAIILAALGIGMSWAYAQSDYFDTLRRAPIDEQPTPPPMARELDIDIRVGRNYPMQPPTIPHRIDNYQVDINTNRCLSCHSRVRTEASQAPMVSVTHYMGRDGQFLAEVSPRQYFCTQCHVPQTDAIPLVENTFEDVFDLLIQEQRARQ